MMAGLLQMDGEILLWIQDHLRNPILTPFIRAFTSLGNSGLLWILLIIASLCFHKTRKAGAAGALALIFSLLLVNVWVKPAVDRIRPYEAIEGLTRLIERQKDPSFPSGHASAAFAAAVAFRIYLPQKQLSLGLLILAAFMAFTRLYVGVHYPTDVLAGILFGILSALLAYGLLRLVERRREKRRE